MIKENYFRFLVVFTVFQCTVTSAQIDPKEYKNAKEIIDQGLEYYSDDDLDKAYTEFLKVNYNDTAFFLARNKAVLTASFNEKYDTVIQLCNEVLEIEKYNPYKEDFINSKGYALLSQKKFEEAEAYFKSVTEEYPRNHLLRFNYASVLVELKNYDKAVEQIQFAIRYNPRYAKSHVKLALLCQMAGDITKAALCMNMAIFLEPDGESSFTMIKLLEGIYSGELIDETISIQYREEEEFDEIDLMLKNKLAENSQYKVKLALQYNFIKHNHLMFEKIEYDPESNGFWNQTYVKMFKDFVDNGHFANYSYLQCMSIDEEKTKSVVKKYMPKILDFAKWGYAGFAECMNERTIWDGQAYVKNDYLHYGKYGFNQIVTQVDGKRTGHYQAFTSNGLLETEGQYTDDGELDGLWKYYNVDGVLEKEVTFKDGKLEGRYTMYYANGSKKQEFHVKDDLIEKVEYYYPINQLSKKMPFNKEGQEHGAAEYYYRTGEVSYKVNYIEGKLDGEYLEYYESGQLKTSMKYIEGKREGEYIAYHQNGIEEVKGAYKNDQKVGHWRYQYDNKQLKEEGECKDGYLIGIWKVYRKNGTISEESDYGETGKKTGVYKEYDLDGNIVIELIYTGNDITSYKTYGKNGEILSQNEKKKRDLEFLRYHSNGEISVKGNYYKGLSVGNWKYYNEYGVLKKELNYNDEGELDGEAKWYFDNAQLETVKVFEKGSVNGYYVDYFRNGKIFTHGWILDGESVGEWETFYSNGELSSTKFFIEGENHGNKTYYDEKGRITEVGHNFIGMYEGSDSYDTLGNITNSYLLVNGKGSMIYKDPNGKNKLKKDYLGTDVHGELIWYYANDQISSKGQVEYGNNSGPWIWYSRKGTKVCEGNYKLGRKDGEWKWYYNSGKLKVTETYVDGLQEGQDVRYFENGQKEIVSTYRNDERHGVVTYYDEKGEIQFVRYYEDGVMTGYSYLGADLKLLEMIPFTNQNGSVETYFANGKKSYHSAYIDGFAQGEIIYYHSNGKIAEQRLYEKGELNGTSRIYYASGKLKSEKEYLNDELSGESRTYHENGKLKSLESYILGDLYGWAEYFNESGVSTERIYYYDDREMK